MPNASRLPRLTKIHTRDAQPGQSHTRWMRCILDRPVRLDISDVLDVSDLTIGRCTSMPAVALEVYYNKDPITTVSQSLVIQFLGPSMSCVSLVVIDSLGVTLNSSQRRPTAVCEYHRSRRGKGAYDVLRGTYIARALMNHMLTLPACAGVGQESPQACRNRDARKAGTKPLEALASSCFRVPALMSISHVVSSLIRISFPSTQRSSLRDTWN